MNKNPVLLLLLLALPILACSRLNVSNESEWPAFLHISMPDGAVDTYRLDPGSEHAWFSAESGPYKIEVMPDQEYIAWVTTVRDLLMDTIVRGGDPDAAAVAVRNLPASVRAIMSQETSQGTCSGQLPFAQFNPYEGFDVTSESVVLSRNGPTSPWTCK